MDHYKEQRSNHKAKCCCFVIIAVIIFIALLFTILAVTVFKAKKPITTVNSISVRNMDVSFNALQLNVDFNVSLDVSVTVKNPNKVGFKYAGSSAFLDYRGKEVGQAPIPPGHISAGQAMPLNVTLTLMADRFVSDVRNLLADLLSGTIPMSTHTRISGKVPVLFFNVHVVSFATCNMNISVANKSLANSDCTYKTEL